MGARSFLRASCLAVPICIGVPHAPALAAWQPDGVPLSPSPITNEAYSLRGLVPDGAGGAFALWEFTQPLPDFSGTMHTLNAQRVNSLGDRPVPWAIGGAPVRSWLDNNPSGTYAITPLPLLGDAAGGAVVPMVDDNLTGDYIHSFRLYHVTPSGAVNAVPGFGAPSGGHPVLGVAADQDGVGGVVMIAIRQTFAPPLESPPPSALYVQRIDALGNALWPPGGTAPGPSLIPDGLAQVGAGLAALADGAGGAFFAWTDLRQSGDPDLFVQHVEAGGAIAAGWPDGGVPVCGAPGPQSEVRLASDGAGGVIVVWRDERDPISHLYASRVLASGDLAPDVPVDGRPLPSSSLDDRFVELTSDAMGGCFVVRAELTSTYSGVSRLHRLDAAMRARGGWPDEGLALNTLSPGSGIVGVIPDGLGGAFVSFRNGFGSLAPQGLYAQHFAPDGSPAPGWSAAAYRLSGTGQDSRIVRAGAGAIVGWSDTRSRTMSVFAQALEPDGPVAAQLALVSATADVGVVALRWFSADGAGLRATLERRTEEAEWSPIGEIAADGSGQLAYDDRAVEPGTRYGYRLSWRDGSLARTSPEAWITVPRGLVLALESPRPNPALGPASVALTLPEARGARLEAIDLSGRRRFARDLSALGAGRHVVALPEIATLAPGVYTLRLTRQGEERRARLCVVR